MSELTRTPGPWHAYPRDDRNWSIVQDHEPPRTSTPIEMSVGNMMLIAAAPDLLALVEEMLGNGDYHKEWFSNPAMLQKARAVVAKAKGETL